MTQEVTNIGSDRSQLANVAREAKAVLQVDKLEAIADRGYFNGEEILACEQADICVTLPKPMTSGAKLEGRFGKHGFVYLPDEDVYRCPAGQRLKYSFTADEMGESVDAEPVPIVEAARQAYRPQDWCAAVQLWQALAPSR